MAKVWKKLQRADSDYAGNVTGDIDGTAVATIKSGASAGTTAKGVTDTAFTGGVLNVANANAALKNSNVDATHVGLGNVTNESKSTMFTSPALTGTPTGITATHVSLGNVANESPTTLKTTMALNNVANSSVATILSGNLTGTIGGTANATVISGATKGATAPVTFKQDAIPTALNAGDMWFDTNDGNKQYRATATGNTTISATTWVAVTASKGAIGLGNVDNTTDAAKQTATLSAATKGDVGLGSVDNTSDAGKPVSTAQATSIATKAPTASPTFTGTVAGVSSTHVGLGSVSNITSTAMREGVTATNVGLGSVSNITTTAMRAGVTKANVGLTNVVDQAITVVSGKLNFDGTAQTVDADKIGGSTLAETKAAAVSTAETNIIGGAPGALQTLDALAAALGDDASFNSTITTSIATKGKAPMTLTAEDVDGDAVYTNDPASEDVGQIGVYSGQSYAVMDI